MKWDAKAYTEKFDFVPQYGEDVLSLIDFGLVTRVLDLGCGHGHLSKIIQDKGVEVIGIDSSPDLLLLAKSQHPSINFLEMDATQFSLDEPVDVVFSNAVFHWIPKEQQVSMLNCVHKALKNNGQFVFEFGGKGNNQLIHAALQKAFEYRKLDYMQPFYFPSIGEYASLLEQCGFRVEFALLFDRLTDLQGEEGMFDWILHFVKKPFVGIEEDVKLAIIREAVEDLRYNLYHDSHWRADYVRLRCKAIAVKQNEVI